jgi:hypothetical protein
MIISFTSLQFHCCYKMDLCDPSLESSYNATDSMQQTQEQTIGTPSPPSSPHSPKDGPAGDDGNVLLTPRLGTRSPGPRDSENVRTTPPRSPEDQEMRSPEQSTRPPDDSGSTASTPPRHTKPPTPPHDSKGSPKGSPPPNASSEDAVVNQIASREASASSEQGVRFQEQSVRKPLPLERIGL